MKEAGAESSGKRSRPSDTILWGRSIAWLLFLGPLFFLTYGGANQRAAGLERVGSLQYDWEQLIPFLPWTIVPYWSIDLLYGLSFLLCRTPRDVDRHGFRLLTVQLICVVCFVLFPLRFGAGQPEVTGLYAPLFNALRSFDQPFNQAPSLHVGLLVVLWVQFVRHVSAPWRHIVHVWALLIGISVLTTFQHHFIDVPTGVLVGALALWLWPEQGEPPLAGFRRTEEPKRRQLAMRYAAGAALFVVPAFAGGAWLWSLWVSTSLLILVLIHLGPGAPGFQKTGGRHSVAVRILLLPYLLGARVNQHLWSRRRPDHDEVCAGVWLGALPDRLEPIQGRLPALVDLTAEIVAPKGSFAYRNQAWLDLVPPTAGALARAAATIEAFRGKGPVLVCCALGFGRSAAAVAAWLILTGRAPNAAAACSRVRGCRPGVVLDEPHLRALEQLTENPPLPVTSPSPSIAT